MDRFTIIFVIGIVVMSIASAAPIAGPLWNNFMHSMDFMPRGY